MTPFQEFRLWARRAPTAERTMAAVATTLVTAVLVWLLVPASSATNSSMGFQTSSSPGAASAAPVGNAGAQAPPVAGLTGTSLTSSAGAALPSQNGAGGGVATGTTMNGSGTGQPGGDIRSTGGGCKSPPGTDVGVSATQIKIAIFLVNVAGPISNTAAGYPTPDTQRQYFQAVIDSVNNAGGVACRKIVATYFSPNIVDQSSLQQACLDVQQGGYFAVLDVGSYYVFPTLAECYPQHKIPYFGGAILPQQEQAQFFPYLFGYGIAENLYRNAVFGLHQRGFFSPSKGFTKLGLVYRNCIPQYLSEVEGYLSQVGVSSSQIIAYSFGCSGTAYAAPSDVEQAVLKFAGSGVHNVMFINDLPDVPNFTQVAQQQNYHPWYGLPDEGEVAASSANSYNYQNLNNAIAITPERFGEQTTPGVKPSSGTQRCNAIFAHVGQPPVYKHSEGAGGVSCDMVWEFAAAVDHSPALQRTALAAGLHAAGSVDWSYPWGPNDFSANRVTAGANLWRPAQFFASCSCWHVLDPNFRRSV